MTPRLLLPALLLAGVLLPWGPAHAQEARTIALYAELHELPGGGFHLVPERIDAKVGDTLTVEVVNRAPARHHLVFCGDAPDDGGECQDVWARTTEGAPLATNASATLTVPIGKAGTFDFYCDLGLHKQYGMKGELVVQGAPEAKKSVGGADALLALVAAAAAIALASWRGRP